MVQKRSNQLQRFHLGLVELKVRGGPTAFERVREQMVVVGVGELDQRTDEGQNMLLVRHVPVLLVVHDMPGRHRGGKIDVLHVHRHGIGGRIGPFSFVAGRLLLLLQEECRRDVRHLRGHAGRLLLGRLAVRRGRVRRRHVQNAEQEGVERGPGLRHRHDRRHVRPPPRPRGLPLLLPQEDEGEELCGNQNFTARLC